ncbi:MAG: radical SAM protein [Candidatus Nanoarchaeia archaeon]|nr:radical SAM protein [Candidatus Nanoarchaeia archaeon]
MRVLFVCPPTSQEERYGKLKDIGTLHPSLGVAYIAAYSESKGHEVKVIDSEAMNYNFEDIKRIILEFKPDVIGMQTFCTNLSKCYKVAEIAKSLNKDIKIILGGAQATLSPNDLIKQENIDFIIYGEAEISFNNLLDTIKNKGDYKKVNGLVWKNKNKIITNKPQELIKDISILPLPARHLFPMEKYHSSANLRGKHTLNIMTSRGCPFRCAYCSGHLTFGKTHRYNSTENIIKELKELTTKYHADSIQFYDETFTANRARVMELCDALIKEKIKISWSCFTRVNLVDEELLIKMKQAGCYLIFFGLESGVQRLLNLIKKDITLEQQEKAVKLCKKVGIEVWGSFILALPTETIEDAKQTIDWAKKLDIDYVQFPICTPFPGTELYEICKKTGKILNENWENFLTWDEIVYVPENRSIDEIKKTVKQAYRTFYLRPHITIKRALQLRKLPAKNIYKMLKAGMITFFK